MKFRQSLCTLSLLLSTMPFLAADAGDQWQAQWIAAPDGPTRDYDVVYFRKTISLPLVPSHFLVDISADTRYELHVNGKRVSAGPALADVHHWRYEVCDLASYLKTGENQIAAVVWNFGTSAPIAQMSSQTAFLLSAENRENASVDTGDTWQVSHEKGRTLGLLDMKEYYAAGTPEVMDGRVIDWSWDGAPAGDAKQWLQAKALGRAATSGAQDSPTRWILEKDELPPMQYARISAGQPARMTGMPRTNSVLLEKPVTIPAHSDVTILLDRHELTTAFPSLGLSGGRDASVDLTYAEALYDARGEKGNRNEIAERHIAGLRDHIISNGDRHTI